MGFKDWYAAQDARNKQWKEGEGERRREKSAEKSARQAAADRNATLAKFEGITLGRESIEFKGNSYPTRGAKGFVEIGGTQRRTTATRLVVGSVITFGIGTAIGAMAKKKTNNIYLTIEFESGMAILIEAKAKQEGDARRFAQAVTTAGMQAGNP